MVRSFKLAAGDNRAECRQGCVKGVMRRLKQLGRLNSPSRACLGGGPLASLPWHAKCAGGSKKLQNRRFHWTNPSVLKGRVSHGEAGLVELKRADHRRAHMARRQTMRPGHTYIYICTYIHIIFEPTFDP